MTAKNPVLFARHDTFFGVCEGIGQDLGFHPNLLRAIFAVSLLFSPVLVVSVYVGLGVIVHGSRFLFPTVRRSKAAAAPKAETAADAANDKDMAELAKAA